MTSGTDLKLFWHVERSRGGTGDHWLNVRAERAGRYSGIASISMSPPDKLTQRELCMSVLHLAQKFIVTKADLALMKHTMQIQVDTCPHKWATCDDTQLVYCWHCSGLQSDIERNQQQESAKSE